MHDLLGKSEAVFMSRPWHVETTMWQSTSVLAQMQQVSRDESGTLANRMDSVAIELLFTQRRQVAGGDEPGAFVGNPWWKNKLPVAMNPGTFEGNLWSETLSRGTLPLVLHWRHCSLRSPVHKKFRRRTHEFPSVSGVVGGDEPSIFEGSPWSKHANLKSHCR